MEEAEHLLPGECMLGPHDLIQRMADELVVEEEQTNSQSQLPDVLEAVGEGLW